MTRAQQEKRSWPLTQIVEVEWEDSGSSGGWENPDVYLQKRSVLCRSIGYLLKKDRQVVLMQSMSLSTGHINDSITIPRACVKRMRRITRTGHNTKRSQRKGHSHNGKHSRT